MNETQSKIFDSIKSAQFGPDSDSFNPDITGCGVSLWRLLDSIMDIEPAEAVREIKAMAADGLITVIEPDANGMMSFLVK